MKKIIIFLVFLLSVNFVSGQEPGKGIVVFAKVVDGDTVPVVPLETVNIYAFRVIKNKREARKLSKLVRNVKKVYPYAKMAGLKLQEYSARLAELDKEKDKRRLMKQAEKEIQDEFGEDLKKLTFTQGKILIKLIDRETGSSSYQLVQHLRGKFIAFFWQTFARIFGYNLKVKYDPKGEDRAIEIIVKMIESGQI